MPAGWLPNCSMSWNLLWSQKKSVRGFEKICVLACVKETTFCETGFPPHVMFLHEEWPHHCQKLHKMLQKLFGGQEKGRTFASSSRCPYQLQHHTHELSSPSSRLRSKAGDLHNLENSKLALPQITSSHFVGSEVFLLPPASWLFVQWLKAPFPFLQSWINISAILDKHLSEFKLPI